MNLKVVGNINILEPSKSIMPIWKAIMSFKILIRKLLRFSVSVLLFAYQILFDDIIQDLCFKILKQRTSNNCVDTFIQQ